MPQSKMKGATSYNSIGFWDRLLVSKGDSRWKKEYSPSLNYTVYMKHHCKQTLQIQFPLTLVLTIFVMENYSTLLHPINNPDPLQRILHSNTFQNHSIHPSLYPVFQIHPSIYLPTPQLLVFFCSSPNHQNFKLFFRRQQPH